MHFYRQILQQAWDHTKTHRWLWLFGLFAALIVGNGGEIDIYFNHLGTLTESKSFLSPSFWLSGAGVQFVNLWQVILNLAGWQLGLAIFGISILSLVVVWFIVTAQIALIYAANNSSKPEVLNFKNCIKAAQKYWWSIFVLNVIQKVFIFGLLLVLAVPWLAAFLQFRVSCYEIMYLLFSFLILVPLAMLVSFLSKYTANYIITSNQRLLPALGSAWKLFRHNWLLSLEMASLIFTLNLLVSFSLLVVYILTSSPFIILSTVTGIAANSFSGFLSFILIAYLILVILIVLLGAIFSAFQWSAWTMLFKEISVGRGQSKITRWFAKKNK